MVSEVPGSNPGWGRCFFFFCFPFLFGGFCSLAGLEDGLKRPLNMSDLHTMTLYIMVELPFTSDPLCPSVLRRRQIGEGNVEFFGRGSNPGAGSKMPQKTKLKFLK